jgi:hypothetical protein
MGDGVTEEEKAYLAGLIDGEGTVTLVRHHRGQYPQPRLAIANNSRMLLEWVKDRLGFGVIVSRSRRKESHHYSFVWQTQCAGPVLRTLRQVEPFLILKKRHARLLLDEYKGCTPRNGKYTPEMLETKKELVEEIRRLNAETRSQSSMIRQAPTASAEG